VEVDTTIATVGDRITLQATVEHAPGSRVVWPDSLSLGPFEVLEARVRPTVTGDDRVQSSISLTLTAFELGDLEIPSFDVEVLDPEGVSTTLTTNRFGIRVSSVGLDEGGDIRDIKGPLGIPRDYLRLFAAALAILLVAGLVWAILRRMRRNTMGPLEVREAHPPRPPHEIALEDLDRLEKSPLLERGEVKEYHIQVSEILRFYVEARFRVPALEMTTMDILVGLERTELEPATLEGLGRFLHECDMVKFAKHRPGPGPSREVLFLGRRFVEDTIPEPALEEAGP
jgi:hypothetical protein